MFRIDEDENSSDTYEKTEITTSTLDTEEVMKDAPKISSAVDIIHANAPQEAEASEEQQLFCAPELEDEEDFVVDMAEDCFINGGDAQPSLGMSQACLSKTAKFLQCCGSESGSTCFWAFWIRIH